MTLTPHSSARSAPHSSIGIGLLGMGVVGGGVAQIIASKQSHLQDMVGCPVELRGVLVRDPSRPRAIDLPDGLITTDPTDVLDNPEVDILVELIGGEEPAREYIFNAMSSRKHIVTANKEVMARHGFDIQKYARRQGVRVLFEAAVAGGTPIIAPLVRDLVANDVVTIHGIINGTTNYILTRMEQDGADFGDALTEAQRLGYAEADPTNDIEGIDAAYKLAILATLGFRERVTDDDVFHEGITRLTSRDFQYARELGYAIKLLGIASVDKGSLQVRVHPAFVREDAMIAKVNGVLNAVEIQTDLAGKLLFHGAGAGAMPTTSAVIADIVDIARHIGAGAHDSAQPESADRGSDRGGMGAVRPISELETRYYIRLTAADRPGVLAQVGGVFAEHDISIASAIQKETDEVAQRAEIVLMTHRANEAAMQQAILELEALETVAEVGNLVRVEEW